MTNPYEESQPLLERRIILLTGEVNETMYRELSWCLASQRESDADSPCQLRITSYGGSIDLAMAMVDLIRADGNCWGVVLGKAASAAADVWLACKQRYVGDHAVIGTHQVMFTDRTNLVAQDMQYMAVELQRRNYQAAKLFADASNDTTDYWMNAILSATSELITYDAQDMIRMGIAKPYAALNGDWPVQATGGFIPNDGTLAAIEINPPSTVRDNRLNLTVNGHMDAQDAQNIVDKLMRRGKQLGD